MTHFTKKNAFEAYEAPVCEVFAAESEGTLCQSFFEGGGGTYDDGNIRDNGIF